MSQDTANDCLNALIGILGSSWPDPKDAERIALEIASIAKAERGAMLPAVKSLEPAYRAIDAALYVARSESGAERLGGEVLARVIKCTEDWAMSPSGHPAWYYLAAKHPGPI